jgi:sporulation protein YlmC with PRC-barrel domain
MDTGVLMRFTDLLDARVTTESGQVLGRVHDLRAELTPRTLKITGLVVGPTGFLERFGIGAPEAGARIRTRDVIPWSDIVRADSREVVVRDEPRKRQ